MADFITSIPAGDTAAVTAWWGTIPANAATSNPSDRYIAEFAGGTYAFGSVSFSGKTLLAGQVIMRPAAGATRHNAAEPARYKTGVVTFAHTFGSTVTFQSTNVADSLIVEDIQFVDDTNGGFSAQHGTLLKRCATYKLASGAANFSFANNGRAVNSLFYCAAGVSGVPVVANGTGNLSNCLFYNDNNAQALGYGGTFNNVTWKNCVAMNNGASDPWPTPPTSFFNAACSNNGTSFATQGQMPGTSPVVGITAAAYVALGSHTTMDATPVAGSVLRNVGVVVAANDGVDYYNRARPGTPGIGPTEYQAPVISWGGTLIGLGGVHGGAAWDSSSISWGGALIGAGGVHGGGWSIDPGTIALTGITEWNVGPVAATWARVVFNRVTDAQPVLTLLDTVVSNGAGDATVTHAALVKGTWYAVSGWNADGSRAFIAVRQAV